MKDCKGDYRVVRIIKEEHLLADGMNWEDAVSVVDARAKDQFLTSYSYEVRGKKDESPHYQKVAHGES